MLIRDGTVRGRQHPFNVVCQCQGIALFGKQVQGDAICAHQVLEKIVLDMLVGNVFLQLLKDRIFTQCAHTKDGKVDGIKGEFLAEKALDFLVGGKFLMKVCNWKGQDCEPSVLKFCLEDG